MHRPVLPCLLTVVAVVLAGCASDGPAVSGGGTVEPTPTSTLLDGVPEDCKLVDDVIDDALQELQEGIDPAVQRGPLVVVAAGDTRLAATTQYGDPVGLGEQAAWVIGPGAGPVTAANDAAATISTFQLAGVNPTGTGPVEGAMASAMDCARVAAERARPDLASTEPAAAMRDELMTVTPATPAPGTIVEVTFTEEHFRGVAWNLDRRDGDDWTTRFWLASDANGGQPTAVPVGTEDFGVDDVGVGGTGPDGLLVPGDAEPGEWRLCTANAAENVCVGLEVAAP